MFENIMYVEELLQNIHNEIFDIDNLQPTEFVNRIMLYPLNSIEDRILIMIRQAVHQYQHERAIMKYIRIVDKLTKITLFKTSIHNHIADIYSQIFYFMFLQKCNKDLQELKLLRKYWLGLIHPFNLTQMKETIINKASIDIDAGIKPETVAKIKQHYATKLNMSPEEINLQFPPSKSIEDPRFSNKRYNIEANSLYPANFSYPQQPNIPNLPTLPSHPMPIFPVNPSFSHQPVKYPQNINIPPYMSPLNGINLTTSPNILGANDFSGQNEWLQETKRKRLASQQTRAAAGMMDGNDPRPRKIQHREQNVVDYKSILCKLNEINQDECKECGIRFSAKDSLENHKNSHFKAKLQKVDGISPAKDSGLCSREQWLKTIDKDQLTHDRFQISQSRWAQHTTNCVFCCSLLTMQFKHNQWVFVNATIVSIQGKQAIMHKSCQSILQKNYSKNKKELKIK